MKALVVLPTYNEAADVARIVQAILETSLNPNVIVVDDSSPDGTAVIVGDAIRSEPSWSNSVQLLTRAGKGGRGGAVRDGFDLGLANDADYDMFIEMDSDFSHDPSELIIGSGLISKGWDVVIGSRYPDGEIIGWPMPRRIFSQFANLLARALIVWNIPDYTNGFRFYSRRAAEAICAEPQRHTGYVYLSEELTVCLKARMTVTSFPTVFRNRERGESNTSLSEIRSAGIGIVDVARWHRRNRGTSE